MIEDTANEPERPVSHARVIGRFRLVAMVLPLLLTVIALVVQLVALPRVPAEIAVHWGVDGRADGFGPAWTSPVLTSVLGIGLPALFALTSLPALRRGDRGHTFRLMGTVSLAVTAFVTVLATGMLVAQVGLADAADAPRVTAAMLIALGAGAVGALVGWFLQPAQEPLPTAAVEAQAAALEGDPVWVRTAEVALAARVVLGIALILVWGVVALMWVSGAPVPVIVLMGFVALAVTAAVSASTAFHMRVDASGLGVVGLLGWPRVRVRAGDIATVEVVQVSPLGEFGGWGYRFSLGVTGVVVRAGEGIRVTRRSNGRAFVVTVDDAETGAALLRGYAERA